MHGDHVLAKITRLSGLPGARRAEGRILRIVSRAHPSIVGLFRYTSRGCVVAPYDPRVQHDVELAPAKNFLSLSANSSFPTKRIAAPNARASRTFPN